MERESGTLQSDQATFFLGPENEVERIVATGNVNAESTLQEDNQMRARADDAELLLASKQNLLRTATLTGRVHVERIGSRPMQGDAGRVILDFLGQNQLQKVHAADGVRLAQHAAVENTSVVNSSPPQNFDITAPIIDFFVIDGRRLDRAQTSGAAQIKISPAANQIPRTNRRKARSSPLAGSTQNSPQRRKAKAA